VSVNPTLTQMVVQTRMADMRRAAARTSDGTRGQISRTVTTRRLPTQTGAACPVAARRAVGWFLVSVGLRLARPRPRPAAAR